MTVSGHPAPAAPRNVQLPLVTFASSQVSLKGEDVILVAPRNPLPGTDAVASQWDLPFNLDRTEESIGHVHGDVQFDRCDFGVYAVFDGHNGVAAATHCKEVFLQLLIEQLPDGAPPLETNVVEYQCWREDLQRALAVTFAQMQHTFAGKGVEAGTTATVVLQVGWLITCANVGDSLGFIDTGAEILQLTADHRIDGNIFEQARVTEAGGVVSTVDKSGHGPAPDPSKGLGGLRVWPGGMANSRAIGDFSAGQLLLSSPNITQMLIPPGLGARLVIASDGVWDGYYGNCQERVAKLVRRTACRSAATKIISTLVHSDSLRDDTSVVVIDLTPPGSDFPQMVSTVRGGSLLSRKRSGYSINSAGSSGSGKSCCFSQSRVLGDDEAPSGHPSVSSSMKVALTASTDPSVSATSSAQSAQLQVFTEVDVAWVLDQLPRSVPAPRGGVPLWPQPRLSMAMLETQEEAHSVFARAAIQRRSIGMAGLSRGGSSSLLNLLACDMEERSVRRSRAFGSGSFDPSLSKEFAGFPRLSSSGTGCSPTSTSRQSRNGSDEDISFSVHLSSQSTELADAALESDIADLQGSDPRRVSYMQGDIMHDISTSGTLRNGCPVGESSMRRLENGMPLKSAMRKSSSSGGIGLAVMQMTALQLSEGVKLSGGH